MIKSLLKNKINLIKKSWLTLCLTIALSTLLVGCEPAPKKASLQRALERGFITVGTLFGSTNYYVEANGLAGFEYELAKKYAKSLNLELKIIPSYNLNELFLKLDSGSIDFIAAGLAVTPNRLKKYRFAPSYDNISQKLVFKQGNIRPRKLADLTGKLMVASTTSHAENLTDLKQTNDKLNWQETSEFDSEELLIKVLDGEDMYLMSLEME